MIEKDLVASQGRARLLEEGRAEGVQEGRTLAQREMAQRMLAKGMEADLVAEVTGLSVGEVNALALGA